MLRSVVSTMFCIGLVPIAHAALIEAGNGLVNHPDAGITWTADGNLFRTQAAANANLVSEIIDAWNGTLPFDHVLVASDFNPQNGLMTYWGALAWVYYLNGTNYKGYNDWRMPDIGPPRPPGSCGGACFPYRHSIPVSSSEWFRLFYEELGGSEAVPIHITHNANYDLFTSITGGWSLNVAGDLANQAYADGGQGRNPIALSSTVWPVRTGLSVANPPPMPNLLLSADRLQFAPQTSGTSSPSQAILIESAGTGPASITGLSKTDGFAVAHDCTQSLPIASTCTATVTFAPTSVGNTVGTLTISTDNRDYTIQLNGTGTIAVEFDASATTAPVGVPVTLSWASASTTANCSASGGIAGDGWTGGPVPTTGSRSVTGTAAGGVNYYIACAEAGQQATEAHTITYTVPSVNISASSTNIAQGQSNTLSWTSTNVESCTASGNGSTAVWNGARATSGSATFTETTTGLITYTIACTAGTQSSQASIQVFVNPAVSGSKGGGGSLTWLALIGLSVLAICRPARDAATFPRVGCER